MRGLKEFLKSKGFYIALGTGIVAFAALMMVYNYSATKEELTREQAIDLNQPALDEDAGDKQQGNKNDVDKNQENNKVAKSDDETEPVDSDGVIKNEKKDSSDDKTTEDAEEKNDEAEADGESSDAQDDTVETSGGVAESDFNYEGEQSLIWPLVGNVILPYSMDTTVYFQTLDSYRCNPGMLIEGEEGSKVMAAYEGVVSAVEDTKEFGTVVRIDMGNGYEAIYGQLMNVCVSNGDSVTMASNIAEVAPVSAYYEKEGNHLYFAITKDGVPVNPISLIK